MTETTIPDPFVRELKPHEERALRRVHNRLSGWATRQKCARDIECCTNPRTKKELQEREKSMWRPGAEDVDDTKTHRKRKIDDAERGPEEDIDDQSQSARRTPCIWRRNRRRSEKSERTRGS